MSGKTPLKQEGNNGRAARQVRRGLECLEDVGFPEWPSIYAWYPVFSALLVLLGLHLITVNGKIRL